MTTDKSLFIWAENDDWWDYDSAGEVVLTAAAPPEAVESFKRYTAWEKKRHSN